jgi:hypothetical protein
MAFADARAIPNIFWEKETDGTLRKNSRGKFELEPSLTIPRLHDEIAEKYNISTKQKQVNGTLLRTLIQLHQPDPNNPDWGVDGNRDVKRSLQSSDVFFKFIDGLKQRHLPRITTAANYTAPEEMVYIYDPEDDSVHELPVQRTVNNFRVLMIHGYDDTQPGMCVYGPYYARVKREPPTAMWPARMSIVDKRYVNKIRKALGWSRELDNWDRVISKEDLSEDPKRKGMLKKREEGGIVYQFLYSNSFQNARPYEGEWSLQLKELKIWSADIELPPAHDEGVRGSAANDRPYERQMYRIFNRLDIFANFTRLLGNFPWDIEL